MNFSDFNWYGFSLDLLKLDSDEERSLPLSVAIEKLKVNDVQAAINALDVMTDEQYYLSILILELFYVKLSEEKSELPKFTFALRNKVSVSAVRDMDIPWKFSQEWVDKVAVFLPDDDVIMRANYYGDILIYLTIRQRCRLGMHEISIPLALEMNEEDREMLANAWSSIVLGLEDGECKDQSLMQLASIGSSRPMIENGGEESYAYGVAIKTFCELGLDSEHPSVSISFKGLLRLSRHMAEKDVRSGGAFTAQIAAARYAGENKHYGWLEIAKELTPNIYNSELNKRAKLALKLAEFYINGEDVDDLKNIVASSGLAWSNKDDIIASLWKFIEDDIPSHNQDYELANAVKAGKDVSVQIAERMKEITEKYAGYYNLKEQRFVLACRLCLPDEQIAHYYEDLSPCLEKEALVDGATYGFQGQPERKLLYLERGYPEGDKHALRTQDLLPILTPDLIRKAERFFREKDVTRGLISLALYWFSKDDLVNASRIINYLSEQRIGDVEWIPAYRRGSDADSTFYSIAEQESRTKKLPFLGYIEDIKGAIKKCETSELLLKLVTEHWQDRRLVEAVLQAANLKKYHKSYDDRCALINVFLIADDLASAIDLLPTVNTGRRRWTNRDYGVEPLSAILIYLKKSTDKLNFELVVFLAKELGKIFPQWVWFLYHSLARLICHLPDESERHAAREILIDVANSKYRREADTSPVYLGLLKGTLEVDGYTISNAAEIKNWILKVKELVPQDTIYVSLEWITKQLANLKIHLPDNVWASLIIDTYFSIDFEGIKRYRLQFFEEMLFHAWSVNDLLLTKEIFRRKVIPVKLLNELRRSIWKDIHLAPEPLAILFITKPDVQDEKILKTEFMQTLCKVLTEKSHPDAKLCQDLIL